MELRISDYHLSCYSENDLSVACSSGKHCSVDNFRSEESNSESVSGGSSDGPVSICVACSSEKHCSVDNFCRKESNSESVSGGSSDGPVSIFECLSIEDHTEPMSINISMNSERNCSASYDESCPKLPKKFNCPDCNFMYNDDTLLCNRNDDSGYLNKDLIVESQGVDICQQMFDDYATFEKHPSFKTFIDVSVLKVEDLPPVYRHKEMFDLIKSLANVVVKIDKCSSSERYIPGSGIVDDVTSFGENDGVCPCSCDACANSPSKEWGSFGIVTSAKLFNSSIKNISDFICTFFYNHEHQNDVVQLNGNSLIAFNKNKDLLMFSCVTCNMSLVKKMKDYRTTYSDCWKTAFDKYFQTVKWEMEKVIFVVSHPYGLRKHLSIGNQLSNEESGIKDHRIGYNLAMCPGCIGAYVMVPDFDVVDDDDFFFFLTYKFPHYSYFKYAVIMLKLDFGQCKLVL